MKQQFQEALQEKNIPILTLDNKWYKLLDEGTRAAAAGTQEQLNQLIRRQGKLNTETKEIRKLKKKLMKEIVEMADTAEQTGEKKVQKKMEQNRKLVEECSEKLRAYQDELLELPREIEKLNRRLMLITMEGCYDEMKENQREIDETSRWIGEIRVELKKRLVRKQELEQQNHRIYSYMHDVFGADVVDLFDMQNYPEE